VAYSFDDLMPSRKGSTNLLCSGAERWIDFLHKNSMRLACALPGRVARFKGSPLPLQMLSECPQQIPRRMPFPLSSVSGIQLRCKMRLHVEAEGDCRQRVKIIPYGQYDAQEQQTEDKHPGVSCQKKDDIF